MNNPKEKAEPAPGTPSAKPAAAAAKPAATSPQQEAPSKTKDQGKAKAHPVIIKKIKKVGHKGHHGGAWKVAYADFVSAMMALFIVLWILSSSEKVRQAVSFYFQHPGAKQKWDAVGESGHKADPEAGAGQGKKVTQVDRVIVLDKNIKTEIAKDKVVIMKDPPPPEKKEEKKPPMNSFSLTPSLKKQENEKRVNDMSTYVEDVINKTKLSDNAIVMRGQNGVRIRVAGFVMFEAGKSEIKSKMFSFLDTIAEGMKKFDYNLLIEGHTDNMPIRTEKFPSNWELSSTRATSILRYLADKKIDPQRLAAIGYADQYPIFPNTTEDGRAKNRRVEFVFTEKSIHEQMQEDEPGEDSGL